MKRVFQRRWVIAYDAHVDHINAQTAQHAKDREAIAVVHRPFARAFSKTEDFVAGGEIGHLEPSIDRHLRNANARHQTQRSRGQAAAALQDCMTSMQIFTQ